VIVGARERNEKPKDKQTIDELMETLIKQHSSRLHVLSVGCDKGIGKLVRDYCIKNKVVFVEVRMKFEGEDIPRAFFAHMFMARNNSLSAVGDEYWVFKGPNENGIVESIIPEAQKKVGESRVHVYGEE
jgi:hypothetical protein